jgi:hypothetical protein
MKKKQVDKINTAKCQRCGDAFLDDGQGQCMPCDSAFLLNNFGIERANKIIAARQDIQDALCDQIMKVD